MSESARGGRPSRRPEEMFDLLSGWHGQRGKPWPEGQLPRRLYLVVDGLVTKSTQGGIGTAPWHPTISELLRRIEPGAVVRGYSYLEPGVHYGQSDTAGPIARPVATFRQHYAPSSNLPTVYLAFSLGCVVSVLGLGALLESGDPRAQHVERLILVQPALMVPEAIRQEGYQGRCMPIVELLATTSAPSSPSGFVVLDQVLAQLRRITDAAIPVRLLYWPGDEILAYTEAPVGRLPVPQLLEAVGVSVERPPLDLLPLDDRTDPLLRHCDVASHPRTIERLEELLRRELGLAAAHPSGS